MGVIRPLECNPRGVSGLHLFAAAPALARALAGQGECVIAPMAPQHLAPAMWLLGAPQALRRGHWRTFRTDLPRGADAMGGAWLVLEGVHLAKYRPFAAEACWINLEAVPDARIVDFSSISPGSCLLAQVPWTRATHEIRALNANTGIAKALSVPKNAACLMIERRTWRIDEAITSVRQIFPGESYRLTAHFSP